MHPLYIVLLVFLFLALVVLLAVYFAFVHDPWRLHYFYSSQTSLSVAPFRPIDGNISQLLAWDAKHNILGCWREQYATYGPVHCINLADTLNVKLDDPHYLRGVMRTDSAHYHKSYMSRVYLNQAIGVSNLLLLEDPGHARHRRMLNPGFHWEKLKSMVETMVAEADKQIDTWLAAADMSAASQVETDIHKDMSSLGFAVIAGCAFGEGFSRIPNSAVILNDCLTVLLSTTQNRVTSFIELLPVVRQLPLWGKPLMDEKRRQMWGLVEQVIADRRAGKTGGGKVDLLDLLMHAKDEDGGKLTELEVRDEALSFVLAGYETTANLMSWMLWKLMATPQLWQECRREVLNVCGMRRPTSDQLKELPILDAVINETLRMYPPVPVIGKQVVTPHTLTPHPDEGNRQPIPMVAGLQVHIDIHILHRLPEYWGDDAGVFDHTRWLRCGAAGTKKQPYSHPFAWLPFSAGERNCIGQTFALYEARSVMCRVLQRVTMEFVPGQLVDAEGAPVHDCVITRRPKFGIMTRVMRNTA